MPLLLMHQFETSVFIVNEYERRYIHNPLLVHGRKFHLRVNVLAVGALQVRLKLARV